MGPKEFQQQIKRRKFLPVYLLYGAEDFLIEEAMKSVIGSVFGDSDRSFNLDIFSANDTDASTVVVSANAFPIMSDYRVIVLKESEKIYSKEPLPSYIKSPSKQTVLVLCAGELKQKTKKISTAKTEKTKAKFDVFAYLNERNATVQFKNLRDADAIQWIEESFRQCFKSISPQATRLLLALKGNSTGALKQEIEKITTALHDEKEINEDHIYNLTGISKRYNIFELSDQVGKKYYSLSQEIVTRLLQSEESAVAIVASLTRHFITLWKVRSLLNKKESKTELSKKAGLFYESQWDNYAAQSRNFSGEALQKCFEYLVQADLSLKSKPTDKSVVMTQLIYQLVHAND